MDPSQDAYHIADKLDEVTSELSHLGAQLQRIADALQRMAAKT